MGVDDGEEGIPEDFKSYNPPHLEYYSEKCSQRREEFLDNIDYFIN